ncbi:hypothetical protein O181_115628, partial [Austropuccinia psidii MF-1]|nr:hypothetical protein [Austropuccinia psidii MF-1]
MEDIITRTRIGKPWTRVPMESKIVSEVQVIKEPQCTEEKEKSDLYSEVSEDKPVEDYPIENITAFFE